MPPTDRFKRAQQDRLMDARGTEDRFDGMPKPKPKKRRRNRRRPPPHPLDQPSHRGTTTRSVLRKAPHPPPATETPTPSAGTGEKGQTPRR